MLAVDYRNYKICIRFLKPTKIDTIEKWLAGMRENGWEILVIVLNVFIFRKEETHEKGFFVLTISFGTKYTEVMYRENDMLAEKYEGHKIPTLSIYQCYSVPYKYSSNMEEIYDKRVNVSSEYAKGKIIMEIFLLISFILMSICSFGEPMIHYVTFLLSLSMLALLIIHVKEYFYWKKKKAAGTHKKKR